MNIMSPGMAREKPRVAGDEPYEPGDGKGEAGGSWG